jgi:hypothetical protein
MPVIALVGLRRLLLLHGLVTLAAAIVLIVSPGLIFALAGIDLPPPARLAAYLLAACELGLAVLSFGGARLTEAAPLRLIAASCAAVHGASALLELYAMHGRPNRVIVLNVIARALLVGLFIVLARPRR